MDCCFFCGQKTYRTFWKRNLFLSGLYDSVTGESFDLCNDCMQKFKNTATAKLFENIERIGLRTAARQLHDIKMLSIEYSDNINNQTVAILSRKHLKNCTGFLVYNFDQYLLFDQTNRQMLINGTYVCSFDEVIDYKVLDNSIDYNIHSPETRGYSTKSNNAIGRAAIGKIISGTAGAVIGGLTAQHSFTVENSGYSIYSKKTHNFSIVIKFATLGNSSSILSIGDSEEEMINLCNSLDMIISLKIK